MTLLFAITRALVLMVIIPVAVYAVANMFLPTEFVRMPLIGELSVRHLLGVVTFLFGFLVWAQRPTGRENDEDFSELDHHE